MWNCEWNKKNTRINACIELKSSLKRGKKKKNSQQFWTTKCMSTNERKTTSAQMKPLSKSVWIAPAACGALVWRRICQHFTFKRSSWTHASNYVKKLKNRIRYLKSCLSALKRQKWLDSTNLNFYWRKTWI